jgi:hypothetical protein
MGEERLNMHLHFFINTPKFLSPDFLQHASMIYLSKERHDLLKFLLPGQEGTLRLATHVMEKYKRVWEGQEREREKIAGDSLLFESYGRFEQYKDNKVDELSFSFRPPSHTMAHDTTELLPPNFGEKKEKRKRVTEQEINIKQHPPVERTRRKGETKKERDEEEGYFDECNSNEEKEHSSNRRKQNRRKRKKISD